MREEQKRHKLNRRIYKIWQGKETKAWWDKVD